METPDHRDQLIMQLRGELAEARMIINSLHVQSERLIMDIEFYRRQAEVWMQQINRLSGVPTANSAEQLRAEVGRFLTTVRIEGGNAQTVCENNLKR
jgi:hypothetical protein